MRINYPSQSKLSLFLITGTLLIILGVGLSVWALHRRVLLMDLYIEGYSFNKSNNKKGLLDIYVSNKGNKDIDTLPLKIDYYSRKDSYLDTDYYDVLKAKRGVLKAYGKANIQLEIICPEETQRIEVSIKAH